METKRAAQLSHVTDPYRHRSFQSLSLQYSIVLATAVLALIGCSGSIEVASRWTEHELKIEGNDSEWKDATTPISDHDVLVGIKNDNDNLYICLITSNPVTQLQMLALGTTIWLSTEEGKDKTFGIQFPVSGLVQMRRFPTRQSSEQLQHLVDLVQQQMEIIGPGQGEHHRVAIKQGKGTSAHLVYAYGTLTYQLKVPLHRTNEHPYALNADVKSPLLIGIETGEFKGEATTQGAASTGSSRGGRQRGRAGSDAGQSSGGTGGETPEPLKQLLVVHLASGVASTPN